MRTGELERLFRRFREDGDANALGEVFDRTAPELLRLASHLTRGAANAEDLVQETFVVAIERAERWDSTRKLLPWLIGILSVQSRRAHGARAVGGSDVIDDPRTTEPAPADAAEERELAEELRRAIDDLPDPYRDVLRMHLREGKAAHEIARELDRAPGTVRVQVHRAFELLRRILPAGAALSAAALATAPRGLAAVRAEVCRRGASRFAELAATGAATLAPRAALSGWLIMNKWAILGVTLVASLFVWITNPFAQAPLVPSTDERVLTSAEVLTDADEQDRSRLDSVAVESERTELASVAVENETPVAVAPKQTRIRGRVTFERDGSNAEAVTVRLELRSPNGPAIRVLETRTDAGGEFAFDRLETGETWIVADRGGLVIVQVAEDSDEWVDLVIPDGVDVDGVVVDESGTPVSGATILLTFPWRLKESSNVTRTDENGRFEIESVGNGCGVGAVAAGHALSRLEFVNEQRATENGRVLLELKLAASRTQVTGTVTDSDGNAIEGAELLLGRLYLDSEHSNDGTSSYSAPHQRTITSSDGRFELTGALAGRQLLCVRAPGWTLSHTEVALDKNETTYIKVELERGTRVFGVVQSAAGSPAPGVEVVARYTTLFPRVHAVTDSNGHYSLPNVPHGEVEMIAHSRRGTTRETLTIIPDSSLEWSVALREEFAIEGRAVDENGRPLEGWWVVAHPAELFKGRAWNKTDAEGRFRIGGCENSVFDLALSKTIDGAVPHASAKNVRPGEGSILLRMDPELRPSSTLTGTLLDEVGQPIAHARLRLEVPSRHLSLSVDSDSAGEFRFGPLASGEHRLRVAAIGYYDALLGTFEIQAREHLDAGAFQLTAPGMLEVHVTDENGTPPASLSAELFDDGEELRAVEIDESGRIRATSLHAVRHVVVVRAPGRVAALRELQIEPDETTRIELRLEAGIEHAISFELSADELAPPELVLHVRDMRGNEVERRLWRNAHAGERKQTSFTLRAGTYRCELVASDRDPRVLSVAQFDVAANGLEHTELELAR